MDTHVVIMAGGIGSRLWPVSTQNLPKQFIDLLGVGKTMIQLTVERFLAITSVDKFWVVTSSDYVDLVRNQIPDIPCEHILAEPQPRNTAPCIAYACWKIACKYPDANIVVTPSDAIVTNVGLFSDMVAKALNDVDCNDHIVTIGVVPSRPETGYGYIYAGQQNNSGLIKVNSFKEKPDAKTAKQYLDAGNYFWNAGIFIWNVNTVKTEIRKYAPNIAAIMDELSHSFYTENEKEALNKMFPKCEKISIDYAVMEKSENIYLIIGDIGWSDLGTWGSVKDYIDSDSEGNLVIGTDVHTVNCSDCIIYAKDAKSVVVEGLSGYIVSYNQGNVLICRLSEDRNISNFLNSKVSKVK
jgi:hypothetical protein